MTKVAAKKSAAVLGDDLALNAHQVTGVRANRELTIVWAVAKGSLTNKAILVSSALVISAVMPWAVTPLLILGSAFLCFEGIEKIAHKFLHRADGHGMGTQNGNDFAAGTATTPDQSTTDAGTVNDASDATVNHIDEERRKIRGAIRTDFVLSAEIVVITLGTVANQPIGKRFAVLVAIAMLMTVGVYGSVAGIVKLDDLGLALSRRSSAVTQSVGLMILSSAPWLLRGLSVVGTAAMFLVGGGILTHGINFLHHWSAHLAEGFSQPPHTILAKLFDALIGLALGALALGLVTLGKRYFRGRPRTG